MSTSLEGPKSADPMTTKLHSNLTSNLQSDNNNSNNHIITEVYSTVTAFRSKTIWKPKHQRSILSYLPQSTSTNQRTSSDPNSPTTTNPNANPSPNTAAQSRTPPQHIYPYTRNHNNNFHPPQSRGISPTPPSHPPPLPAPPPARSSIEAMSTFHYAGIEPVSLVDLAKALLLQRSPPTPLTPLPPTAL